jgi:hypothetical protein
VRDDKNEFRPGNRSWCYLLTVTDHGSPVVLLCEAVQTTRGELAWPAFERLFDARLPLASAPTQRAVRLPQRGVEFVELSVRWLRVFRWSTSSILSRTAPMSECI